MSVHCDKQIECISQAAFGELAYTVLRDWGTCLGLSLYRDATVHLLGGVDSVERKLPLTRSGNELGNQTFHLVQPDEAFHFTAF